MKPGPMGTLGTIFGVPSCGSNGNFTLGLILAVTIVALIVVAK